MLSHFGFHSEKSKLEGSKCKAKTLMAHQGLKCKIQNARLEGSKAQHIGYLNIIGGSHCLSLPYGIVPVVLYSN